MTDSTPNENETRWEEIGEICPHCGYNGAHLIVDGELHYCGRCKQDMSS